MVQHQIVITRRLTSMEEQWNSMKAVCSSSMLVRAKLASTEPIEGMEASSGRMACIETSVYAIVLT